MQAAADELMQLSASAKSSSPGDRVGLKLTDRPPSLVVCLHLPEAQRDVRVKNCYVYIRLN